MKTLVVSNHNSDLEWLKMTHDHGFSPENTVIYDRSDVEKDWSHLGESIRSPNVGENIYDMMRFIIENYDNLPDVAVFIKGNYSQRLRIRVERDIILLESVLSVLFMRIITFQLKDFTIALSLLSMLVDILNRLGIVTKHHQGISQPMEN